MTMVPNCMGGTSGKKKPASPFRGGGVDDFSLKEEEGPQTFERSTKREKKKTPSSFFFARRGGGEKSGRARCRGKGGKGKKGEGGRGSLLRRELGGPGTRKKEFSRRKERTYTGKKKKPTAKKPLKIKRQRQGKKIIHIPRKGKRKRKPGDCYLRKWGMPSDWKTHHTLKRRKPFLSGENLRHVGRSQPFSQGRKPLLAGGERGSVTDLVANEGSPEKKKGGEGHQQGKKGG